MPVRGPIALAEGFNELAMCRRGPMLFNRFDRYVGGSLARYGEFSPGELAAFRQIVPEGGVVVEVGANIGAHTVALPRLVGAAGVVVAFEPPRIAFQALCANLALNQCANVHARGGGDGRAIPAGSLCPALYVENDRAERSAGLIALIAGFEYAMYWHLAPLYVPDNFAGEAEDDFPDIVSINMLCLPRERGIPLAGLRAVAGPEDRPG